MKDEFFPHAPSDCQAQCPVHVEWAKEIEEQMTAVDNRVIHIEPIGWEWTCPECQAFHEVERGGYVESQPLICDECGTRFADSDSCYVRRS